MPLSLLIGDEKRIQVDVLFKVISADANRKIFDKDSETYLENAYNKLALRKGELQIDTTKAFNRLYLGLTLELTISANHIISVAAPTYIDGKHGESGALRACYNQMLNIAEESGWQSIAIPLISSKIYGYPYEEAFSIAISTIQAWLSTHSDTDIALLIFDKKTVIPAKAVLQDVNKYIDNHYEFKANPKYKGFFGKLSASSDKHYAEEAGKRELEKPGRYEKLIDKFNLYVEHYEHPFFSDPTPAKRHQEAFEEHVRKVREELGEKLDDSFSVALVELINIKNRTAVEVYKRANIDRKLFSKIRNDYYIPGKKTAVALAIALELSLEEANDLLKHAGYTLSRSLLFDVIIEYFIVQGNYDIYEINNVLFDYGQPILGG